MTFGKSAAASAAFLMLASQGAAQEVADRIWSGGPILTMNDSAMRAEAVAEKGGRVLAVGSTATVMAHKGPNTKSIDLGGRAMLPGFVDAHGHVFGGGVQALSANLLSPPDGRVTDIPGLQQTLRDWMAQNAEAVEKIGLVMGFGYDNAMLAERRHPTREELDAITTKRPVYVVHQSGHFGTANSKALELARITPDTPNPPGGVIRRKADGKTPDGVLEETAHYPAMSTLLARLGPEGAKTVFRAGVQLWARYGYTTAQEGRSVPPIVEVMRLVAKEKPLPVDVVTYPDVLVDRDFIRKNVSATYTDRVRVAGAKLTIDGSPQGFTAWRDRPYYKPVGSYPPGYAGYQAATNKEVLDAVDWAFANKIQVITHANGEAASDLLIAALQASTAKYGVDTDRRPVLIHGQFLREDQVDSYKAANAFLSLFPMHTYYWGDWHRDHTVGPALADNISPTGWLVSRGMKFSSHHDAPVAFPDSMRVLSATVTRRSRSGDIIGPTQRVDVLTALKAMTIWPAFQHFEEGRKGSIEAGKVADFVILSKDPTAVDPETLQDLKITETIKDGVTVFAATPNEQKRGDLMLRPRQNGVNDFARFIRQVAIEREIAAAPTSLRTDPTTRLAIEAATHDEFCLTPALSGLIERMVETGATH